MCVGAWTHRAVRERKKGNGRQWTEGGGAGRLWVITGRCPQRTYEPPRWCNVVAAFLVPNNSLSVDRHALLLIRHRPLFLERERHVKVDREADIISVTGKGERGRDCAYVCLSCVNSIVRSSGDYK